MLPAAVVYVIGQVSGGPLKIGFSASEAGAEERRRHLQAGNPRPLEILMTFPGPRDLETALHRHFAANRLTGEWFDLAALDAVAEAVAIWRRDGDAGLRALRDAQLRSQREAEAAQRALVLAEALDGRPDVVDAELRRLRELAGLTKSELAGLLGVGAVRIGAWENGTRPIDSHHRGPLAKVLAEALRDPDAPKAMAERMATAEGRQELRLAVMYERSWHP